MHALLAPSMSVRTGSSSSRHGPFGSSPCGVDLPDPLTNVHGQPEGLLDVNARQLPQLRGLHEGLGHTETATFPRAVRFMTEAAACDSPLEDELEDDDDDIIIEGTSACTVARAPSLLPRHCR